MPTGIIIAFLLLAAVLAAQQGTSPLPPAIQLSESATTRLSVPPFSSIGSPQCDADGDLFFHISRPGITSDNTVLEISPGSSAPVLYHLGPDLVDKMSFTAFGVTPSGDVDFLDYVVDGGGLALFTFDSHGEVQNQTELSSPVHLHPTDFMMSEDGSVFLTAYFTGKAPQSEQGSLFEGVFDKSGKLREQIRPEGLQKVDLKNAPMIGNDSAAWGVDGNFYVLRPREVLVMSEGGEVVRRMAFQNPDPQAQAMDISTAKGLVSIEFIKIEKRQPARAEYLVMEAGSGAVVAHYLPPEGTGSGIAACFLGNDGYSFLAQDKKGLKVVSAELK